MTGTVPGELRTVLGRQLYVDPTPIRHGNGYYEVAGYDAEDGLEVVSTTVDENIPGKLNTGNINAIAEAFAAVVREFGWDDEPILEES